MVQQSSSPRLLIVEDEPLFAESLRRALVKQCAPIIATSLAAARRELRRPGFSGFLLDVMLPDGSGLDLVDEIRERHPLEPIVIMTGSDPATASRDAFSVGAMFVAKPMPEMWLGTVRAWFDPSPRASRELQRKLALLGLSARELEVFTLLATGAPAEAVAEMLGLSTSTIRSHCHRVYERLGASSLTEVVAMAHAWRA